MRRCSITRDGRDLAAVVNSDEALVPVATIAPQLPSDLLGLLTLSLDASVREQLADRAEAATGEDAPDRSVVRPLYRHPSRIWGTGRDYRAHADDLGAPYPTEPASFVKGDHTIIGRDEDIVLPPRSERVTAEAELGPILGCNRRLLTRSEDFPTFFSFSPELVTMDEVLEQSASIDDIVVSTEHNGRVHRENVVSDMTFRPARLVSFHSQVTPLFPGDIISTGTPGAVVIQDGDRATCGIDGIGSLHNPVVRPGGGR